MRLRRKIRGARVEMLPLMDVIFLLLVFCIYAMLSMSPHRGLRLNLPASASARIDKDDGLAVSLKADGSLYLNEESFAPEQLGEQLALRVRTSEKPDEIRVDVFAEKEAGLQDLYRVLDLIKTAGIEKISLRAVPTPASPVAPQNTPADAPAPVSQNAPPGAAESAP
jgi:biopolymer transport protein ExbD